MNISYAFSLLDLYLLNEKEGSLIVEVLKKDNLVKIDFSYTTSPLNKTYIKIDKNIFFDNLEHFIFKVKENIEIDEEKIDINSNEKTYVLKFKNNRSITFANFSDSELLEIRKKLNINTDINLNKESIKLNIEEIKENSYTKLFSEKSNLKFSMGFSSYVTLLLSAFLFLDVFMIALWVFGSIK